MMKSYVDKILSGDKLTDCSINCACNLLKQQFTKVKALHLTLYQRKKHSGKFVIDNIEIIYSRDSHWIVATTMMCINDEVLVYDSVFNFLDDDTVGIVRNLFGCGNVKMVECQKQHSSNDCGLFSIANATAIVNGIDPKKLKCIQSDMRTHLPWCFQ